MVLLEIQNLDLCITWVDGFVPSSRSIETIVEPDLREALSKGAYAMNDVYLTTLRSITEKKYHGRVGSQKSYRCGDIYLIAPSSSPSFPGKYNPIYEEYFSLRDNRSNYRLLLLIGGEDHTALEDCFHDSLEKLLFTIRHENSYINLQNFKTILHEMSILIIERYIAPGIQVKNDLKSLGLNGISEPIG